MNATRTIAGLLIGTLAACSPREKAQPPQQTDAVPPGTVGGVAPRIVVATLGGDSARVGGAARQPLTLVNVWATWCGPCKAEFPELQAIHSAYGKRGLRVLAVSIDADGDAAVAASAAALGATFTIGRDPDDMLRGQLGAVGIPESWLISEDGRLLWRHSGAIQPGDSSVRAAIDSALAAPAGPR
jgi:thiol-disulfide isomerase/thioredoxin